VDKAKEYILDYICVLSNSLEKTTDANDRPKYLSRLAEAACWLGRIHKGASIETIKEKIEKEVRSYGWSYFSGTQGEAAESERNRPFISFES